MKQGLLEGYPLENWYPDVWILTEADEGCTIEGDSRDAFVLRLKENSGAGYPLEHRRSEKCGIPCLPGRPTYSNRR